MKQAFLLLSLLLLSSCAATVLVKGTVYDENNDPLMFCTVYTSPADFVITNSSGQYSLYVPNKRGLILGFQLYGYVDTCVVFNKARKNHFDVHLQPDTTSFESIINDPRPHFTHVWEKGDMTDPLGYQEWSSPTLDYELCTYLDNLAQDFVPDLFLHTYYGNIETVECDTSQVIDRIHKRREIYIRTREARDGYLYVNECIMDFLANNDRVCFNGLKVAYVYNNKEVATEKDVMEILHLRKGRIRVSDNIVPDDRLGVITIYIYSR